MPFALVLPVLALHDMVNRDPTGNLVIAQTRKQQRKAILIYDIKFFEKLHRNDLVMAFILPGAALPLSNC